MNLCIGVRPFQKSNNIFFIFKNLHSRVVLKIWDLPEEARGTIFKLTRVGGTVGVLNMKKILLLFWNYLDALN